MGTKIETTTMHVCDICGSSDSRLFLHTCLVCGKEFCTYCDAPTLDGTRFNYKGLCKICAEKPTVKEIIAAFKVLYANMQEKEKEWLVWLGQPEAKPKGKGVRKV